MLAVLDRFRPNLKPKGFCLKKGLDHSGEEDCLGVFFQERRKRDILDKADKGNFPLSEAG